MKMRKHLCLALTLGAAICLSTKAQESALEKLVIENDVVQISSPEDFQNFATVVNSGTKNLDAVLTQDVNLDVIGTESYLKNYSGTFDGQFNTLTYNAKDMGDNWGLFQTMSGTIKNLRVSGSITTLNTTNAGLVCSLAGGTLRNIYCDVNITSTGGTGLFGGIARISTAAGSKIIGCVYAGVMSGETATNSGGIICYADNAVEVSNCIFSGRMDINLSNGNSYTIARNPKGGIFSNCYYLNDTEAQNNPNTAQITEEQMKNGYACFLLNVSNTENPAWRQNIGEDSMPLLDPTHKIVYANGSFKCDGITSIEGSEITYSNEKGGNKVEPHKYEYGMCTECGVIDPESLVNNVFQISSANHFLSFAKLVQGGNKSLDAVLTDDINLDEVIEEIPLIGYSGDNGNMITSGSYEGTFDGQLHTITYNKVPTADIWGLFGSVSGTIRNLRVTGSITTGNQYMATIANTLNGGTVENCESSVDIITTAGSGFHGGISRVTTNAGGKVLNCLYSGSLSGETAMNCAAIICYAESGSLIKNTIFTGQMEIDFSNGKSSIFNRGTGNACVNCYYLNECDANANNNVVKIEEEQLVNGFCCMVLVGDNTGSPVWHQTLGVDPTPVLSREGDVVYCYDGIYSNAKDNASLQDFVSTIVSVEKEYVESLKVSQSLETEFNKVLDELQKFENVKDVIGYCNETITPMKMMLAENAATYETFKEKVEEAVDYLQKMENFDNPILDELENYLKDYAEPNEAFAHGTASYIMEERLLNTEELLMEIEYISMMLTKILSYDPQKGMDVTNLFNNTDFSRGFDGWDGTVGTNSDISETSSIRTAESRNKAIDMSQTLTGLKNGVYELQINGAFQPYPTSDYYSTNYSAVFYLNDNYNYFQANIEDMISEKDAVDGENCFITPDVSGTDYQVENDWGGIVGYTPSSAIGCSNAFKAGRYSNSILVNVTDGTLTMGIKQLNLNGHPGWLGFGNIKVIYRGTMEEASEAMSNVLSSQVARANTLLNVYQSSSAADYASYPNFSKKLKDDLKSAIYAAETASDVNEKYELISQLSNLFLQVCECKKAYISLMDQHEDIESLVFLLDSYLSEDIIAKTYEMANQLSNGYEEGTISKEEAEQDYMSSLPFMPQQVDGIYQLGSDIDFVVFSIMVNNGNYDINAELTSDINLDNVIESLPMVGEGSGNGLLISSGAYNGVFDGKCHTITYHKVPSENLWGLFGGLSGTVKNLRVSGSITTDYLYMAGIANTLLGGTLQNCVCDVDIITTSGNGFHGGLSRVTTTAGGKIIDCVYAGQITGPTAMNSAGILCFSEKDVEITNCLFVGKLDIDLSNGKTFIITRNPSGAIITNCYYLNDTDANANSGTMQITEEQLTSGEVCDMLNGEREMKPWSQHVEVYYPLPFPNETAIQNIYDNGAKAVSGSSLSGTYNLMGQKISRRNQKGLYIVNEKKVLY